MSKQVTLEDKGIILDYNILSSNERSVYIEKNFADILPSLSERELEFITDYILFFSESPLTQRDDLAMLETVNYSTKEVPNSFIKKKNNDINYADPALKGLKEAIEKIQEAEKRATDNAEKKKLQKWRSELVGDAHLFPNQGGLFHELQVDRDSTIVAEAIIDELFDFTNEYHLRAFLIEYYNLEKSQNMKPMIDFFNELYERTPMEPWERALMERWKLRDQYSNLEIQQYLYKEYGQIINHANYLNQVIVRLCRSMVDMYYMIWAEKVFAEKPEAWKFCPTCGKWKLNEINVWKQTGVPTSCEVCRLKGDSQIRYTEMEKPFDPVEKRLQPMFMAKGSELIG